MYSKRLALRSNRSLLIFDMEDNRLIIKEKKMVLFDIDLDQIEEIRVNRANNQGKRKMFEVSILGPFVELAKISLNQQQSFQLKSWLEKIVEQRKRISFQDFDMQYPRVSRHDWLYSIWQIGAVIVIMSLLFYIFFIGLPGLRKKTNLFEEKEQTYEFFLDEGKKYIEQNRLTDGINHLEDAKQIKDTKEIQLLLDAAYLERAEFFYQNKEFQKSWSDIKQVKTSSQKSEKLAAMLEKEVNDKRYMEGAKIQTLKDAMEKNWDLQWNQTMLDNDRFFQWDGKRFDVDLGIIFACQCAGENKDQIKKIWFKSELMQKDLEKDNKTFETISQNFLEYGSQLALTKEDQMKISNWINLWYPKIINSNYQVKEQIAGLKLILMGEKGIRYLEINVTEDKKNTP